ncbi:MAG: hypothetical protein U0T73_00690 [Chitinophagales bacterium]
MKDTKCFLIWQSLNRYERRRLRKFLCSPLHNEDAVFVKLHDLFIRYEHQPDREQLAKVLFGRKKLSNQEFARLFSRFSERIERFLALENYYAEPVREQIDLLGALNQRRLSRYFPEKYRYIQEAYKRVNLRSGEYYLHAFELEKQQHEYFESQQLRSNRKNLTETLTALDTYYFIQKLRLCAAVLHYQSFLTLEGDVALINEILDYLDHAQMNEVPLLHAYYLVVKSLLDPNNEIYFNQLKRLISGNQPVVELSAQRDLFAFAINYCITRINSGDTSYQRQIFELYQMALLRNVLEQDDELSPWDFKNIVTVALRNKEFSWTEKFIDAYKDRLPVAEKMNAITFNKARYFFAIKNYNGVLKLLQDVTYSDIFYLLDAKTTLMKTYFELGEYQPLQSLKESFRILLRRKKVISEQNQTNYGNFARYTMKLFRTDVKDKKKLERLGREIRTTGNIADKGWLLEKLAELGA